MRFDKNAFDCLIEIAGEVAEGKVNAKSKERLNNASEDFWRGERESQASPQNSVVFGRSCPTKGEDPSLGL